MRFAVRNFQADSGLELQAKSPSDGLNALRFGPTILTPESCCGVLTGEEKTSENGPALAMASH